MIANEHQIPLKLEPWPNNGLRRVSVNSFGYGGTNAHVILDEAHHYLSTRGLKDHAIAPSFYSLSEEAETGAMGQGNHGNQRGLQDNPTRRLFVLSAESQVSLENAFLNLKNYLLERSETDSGPFLDDLAYTLSSRRSLFIRRVAYHAATVSELIHSMNSSELKLQKASGTPKLGFVFTGQGAQWYAMGRELIDRYPTFKRSLLLANDHFSELGAQWNVIGRVYAML